MISPELLRRHTFFGGFSPAALKELATAGGEQTLAAGDPAVEGDRFPAPDLLR
jgi:hypothetical protein